MGLEAKALFPEINFEKAIMVGDTDNDLAFGQALSMKTVLIKSEEKVNRIPDEIVSSLYDLIQQV
jgi:phosphoglycolate phosphatase-like HAD superfamily hydrolase